MNTYETMKHNIPDGATHYQDEGNGYLFAWFKEDGGSLKIFVPEDPLSSWTNCFKSAYEDLIKPIPSDPDVKMSKITEFSFGDVSIDFSEDERVIVQDDDVKLDVETEAFKQICIQYLCLECPDVIKFDDNSEAKPTYRYEKVTDSIFGLKEEFERGELYSFDGDDNYVRGS